VAKQTGVKVITMATSVGATEQVKNYFDLFDYGHQPFNGCIEVAFQKLKHESALCLAGFRFCNIKFRKPIHHTKFFLFMFQMFSLPFMVQAFVVAVITGLLLSYLCACGREGNCICGFLPLARYLHWAWPLPLLSAPVLPRYHCITLAGALLMSFINIRDKRLKQEAIIGILYAFASAAYGIALFTKTPHGDSDIQEVLFGNILSVSWEQITLIAHCLWNHCTGAWLFSSGNFLT
jgi:hypothetical protein